MAAECARRSPWVFSSRDVAVAAVPKLSLDPRSGHQAEDNDEDEKDNGGGELDMQLVSSGLSTTTTP